MLTLAMPLYIKQLNVIFKGNAEGPVVEKPSSKFKIKQYSWLLLE